MKKSIRFVLAATLCLGATSISFAADEGAFFEGSVGSTTINSSNFDGFSMNKTSTSWGFTGGYMFNSNIGLEGGYQDLGKVSGTASLAAGTYTLNGKPLVITAANATLKGDSTGWLLGVRGNIPVNSQFSLNGRVGLYQWKSEASVGINAAFTYDGVAYAANGTFSKSYTGSDAYYGVGANYNFNKQTALGLGYTQFKMGGDVKTTVDNWALNLNYRF